MGQGYTVVKLRGRGYSVVCGGYPHIWFKGLAEALALSHELANELRTLPLKAL